MNRGIYSAATGMIATQHWMDVVTNNLSNSSTIGFKKDSISFQNTMDLQLQVGNRSIGSIGAGSMPTSEYTDIAVGSPIPTHNPLDVAIATQKGVFAIQGANGQTLYTRDGSFDLNENRQLVNKGGELVLDEANQPIRLPNGSIDIAKDGTIHVDGKLAGKIGLFDGTFEKVGGNLFRATTATTVLDDVDLKPQSLEGSNVNAIESMVQMISLSRSFELAQKSITQQDDLTGKLIQSLQ